MSEGLERRVTTQDNLRGATALQPTTRQVSGVPAPRQVQQPDTSFSDRISQSVSRFATGKLREMQGKKIERSMMDGRIAAMQGEAFENLEVGGDKWAMEGYRVTVAQTMSAGLLRAQEADIAKGQYESDPDAYRQTLVNRIEAATSSISDQRTREMVQENMMEQMPGLVDEQLKQNIAFKEQENFTAVANGVDTMSKDPSKIGYILGLADGTNPAAAGMSEARRKEAVVQGVINSFTNGNPIPFAHLEGNGFLNTENVSPEQIQRMQSARNAWESKVKSEWNEELHTKTTALEEAAMTGEYQGKPVSPTELVTMYSEALGEHGLRMNAQQASSLYENARAGVEFDEGTRGLNIQAAGVAGDYSAQAELMADAVIWQESRGNPNAVSPVGASGIMQLMPPTMMNPGFGVRNIFEVARSLGVPVSGTSEADAVALSKNPDVNETMGKEYLAAMLQRYNGDTQLALVAYNAGAGNADKLKAYGGDWQALEAGIARGEVNGFDVSQAKNYEKTIRKAFNDDMPDPNAKRAIASARYDEALKARNLQAWTQVQQPIAELDAQFENGEMSSEDWLDARHGILNQAGVQVDHNVLTSEMSSIRAAIKQATEAEGNQLELHREVAANEGVLAAESRWETAQAEFSANPSPEAVKALQQARDEYVGNVAAARQSAGLDPNISQVTGAQTKSYGKVNKLVSDSIRAGERATQARVGIQSGNLGAMPADVQKEGLNQIDKSIARNVQNNAAANGTSPQLAQRTITAQQMKARIDNGVVDEDLSTYFTTVGTGDWFQEDGAINPQVLGAMQQYWSLAASRPELAADYINDPVAVARMNAVVEVAHAYNPDLSPDALLRADMSNEADPARMALSNAIRKIGSNEKVATPEQNSERVAQAMNWIERGNLTGTFMGGLGATDAADRLVPNSRLDAIVSGVTTLEDAASARFIDQELINTQFDAEVKRYIEDHMQFLPNASNSEVARSAMASVAARGAVVGNSFVMPKPGEPSIKSQMFPGEVVTNSAAVNTAVSQWLQDPATQQEHGLEFSSFFGLLNGTPEYSVHRQGGHYVATILNNSSDTDDVLGSSTSIILPLKAIGDHYKERQ